MITLNLTSCVATTPRDWSLATIEMPYSITIGGMTMVGNRKYGLQDLSLEVANLVASSIDSFINLDAGWLVVQASIKREDIVKHMKRNDPSQSSISKPEPPQEPIVIPNYRLTLALSDAETRKMHGNQIIQTVDRPDLHEAADALFDWIKTRQN